MNIAKTFQNQPGILKQETLRPARVFSRDFTFHYAPISGDFQKQLKRKHFDLQPEQILFLNKNWKLFSPIGFLQSPSGQWILESFSFPFENEYKTHYSKQEPSTKQVHLSGMHFVFTNVGFANYYHVITELVPRLEFWLPFKGKVKLAVSSVVPIFLKQAFEKLDITEEHITYIEPGITYTSDVWVTLPWGLNFIPERFHFMKSALNKTEIKTTPKRIYISRKNESNRFVQNEEDLLPLLKQFGFELLCLESYNFDEQVEICSQAEWICGPHGAGLSNLIWMKHPKVIEIRPESYPNDCFVHLSLTNYGSEYALFEAQTIGTNALWIDVNRFEEFLGILLL